MLRDLHSVIDPRLLLGEPQDALPPGGERPVDQAPEASSAQPPGQEKGIDPAQAARLRATKCNAVYGLVEGCTRGPEELCKPHTLPVLVDVRLTFVNPLSHRSH